jgi:hypothetical protein
MVLFKLIVFVSPLQKPVLPQPHGVISTQRKQEEKISKTLCPLWLNHLFAVESFVVKEI